MLNPRAPRPLVATALVMMATIALGIACKVPPARERAFVATVDVTPSVGAAALDGSSSVEVDAGDAASPVDPCVDMFTGLPFELPRQDPPMRGLGQPATLRGATSALCRGRGAPCEVSMLLPAGQDEQTGDAFFVSRVDWTAAAFDGAAIDYFLVVAQKGKITRIQHLVDTGFKSQHWRDQQITVGPDLFVWRSSGYGAPSDPADYQAWKHGTPVSIQLSTLQVDGCAPPPHVLTGPLVRHWSPF